MKTSDFKMGGIPLNQYELEQILTLAAARNMDQVEILILLDHLGPLLQVAVRRTDARSS